MTPRPTFSPELEQRLQKALLADPHVGVTVQDAAGQIVYANEVATAILGCTTPEELCRLSVDEAASRFEVFYTDGRAMPPEEMLGRVALRGEERAEIMLRFRRRGHREERWSLVRAIPVRDAAGVVTHAVNLFREVTGQSRAEEYQRFLLRAHDELTSSLDYEKTLTTVAGLAVPLVADWCAVDLVEGEGAKRVAAAHVDPEKVRFVEEIQRRYPPRPNATRGIRHVLRTGEPDLMNDIPAELLASLALDPEHLRLIEQLELRSYVCVPLKVRGTTIGALTFVMAESGRRYTEHDLDFVQALANRAALAIDNARLFHEVSKARQLSEESLRLMVASVKDYAIFMLDPKGHVASWNAGAQLINGYTAEEIIGQHFSRFYPAEDIRAGKCEYELAVASREGRFEDEDWRLRKDGSRFWANVVITAVRDETGRLRGFAKVTRDLTDRRRAEERLAEEKGRRLAAERSAHFAQLFMGVLGHDLRNPLAAIITGASYLARLSTSDLQSRTVARIASSAERMARMIEQLLDLTRVGIGGGLELSTRRTDLSELARGVVEELGVVHPDHPVHCDLLGDLSGTWDPDRLAQALSNLVGNALQHGAPRTPVGLKLDGRSDPVRVTLHNQGVVPAAKLPSLFEPFKGTTVGSSSSGLGLGLYITREIVRAHGGEICVRSQEPEGTTFTLTLPRVAGTVVPPSPLGETTG